MDFPHSVHYLCGGLNVEVTQNIHTMATAHYTPTHCPDTGRKFTRSERKAANKARFKAELKASTPKPKRKGKRTERKGQLVVTHHGDALNTRVYTLAPKRKPAKASTLPTKANLMRRTKAELVDMLMLMSELTPTPAKAEAPKPKRKPKRKSAPKARKATPSQRVADRQDRTHHGRPDTPVTPQAEPHTADVEAARATARQTGARNRNRRAFDLATSWAFNPGHGGHFTPEQQGELTRLLGSTDVSTYEDVVALTH